MNKYLPVFFAIVVLLTACRQEHVDSVRLVESMINTINMRELDALDGLVSQNIERHSAATPDVVVTNLDQFKDFLKDDFAMVPDSVQEIDIIFASENYVALSARYLGTQLGPFGPFPPSGRKLELHFMGILRIEAGKIAEIWVEWDNLSALSQLGYFPPPATISPDRTDAEREVLLVQADRFRAMTENDISALESIFSDDLVYTHTTGRVETKAEFLSALHTRAVAYHSIEPMDVKVRIYDNTAVVTGASAMKVSAGAKDLAFSLQFIEVYENSKGRWRLLAWQSTRLPDQ
jgi:predicted ester cyclase